jgi:predicted hotdog family 3-hydroxylacyl-ACP dehydratase
VVVEGPVIKTKSATDINLACIPHTDAMVIIVHIDRWDATKILVDNGSQAKVINVHISVFDSQKDMRNIEQGFSPGYKNVHFLREAPEHYQQHSSSTNTKAPNEMKPAIKANCDTKKYH